MGIATTYMPQDVFNLCAVTAARLADSGEVTLEQCAQHLTDAYHNVYINDGVEKDIVVAAANVI